MEELPPVLEPAPTAPSPPAMCLAARLLNVFAIPGEVFEVVKASRVAVWNWLLPGLLSAVVGVFMVIVVVSQPALQREMQNRIQAQNNALAKQVKEGQLKQADADRVMALTRAIAAPPILRALAGTAAAVLSVARVFWWALVLWVLGRSFLKVRFDYLKALEVAGLALMISVLGAVVTVLLTVNLPRMFATPSLALAISDFDASRKSHLLLGAANVFSLWLVGVLSVGLARLANVPFLRAAWCVFAAWVIQESFLLLLGGTLGQFVL